MMDLNEFGQMTGNHFFPAPREEVFSALHAVINDRFRFFVTTYNPYSKNLEWSTGHVPYRPGTNFSARVVPTEGGCLVTIAGIAKVAEDLEGIQQHRAVITDSFTELSRTLQIRMGSEFLNVSAAPTCSECRVPFMVAGPDEDPFWFCSECMDVRVTR